MSKKYLISIVLIVLFSTVAWSQNANRSGLFLEFGAGGYLTKAPLENIIITNIQSSSCTPSTLVREDVAEYESGIKLVGTLGYRYAFSRNWAADVRTNFTFGGGDLMMLNITPGVRYTSPELFKNISLYCAANLGLAWRLDYGYYVENMKVGFCASAEAGVNLTSKLYLGVFYNFFMIPECFKSWKSDDTYDSELDFTKGTKYANALYPYVKAREGKDFLGVKLGFRF